MSIVDAFSKHLNNIKSLLTKSVSKSFISSEANITIGSLEDSINALSKLQSSMKIDTNKLTYEKKDKQYQNYLKRLSGTIAQEETKNPLESLKIIADIYSRELQAVKSYVAHNKEADKLTDITTVKYSQVTMIGLLEQSIRMDRYIKAMVFKVFHFEKPNDFKKDFPWMFKFLDDNNEFFTDQVNRYSNNYKNQTNTMSDKIVGFFKKKNYDPTIVVDGAANTNYASLFEDDGQIKQFSILGIPFSLNIFAWGANMYMLYNHHRVMQKEYEKSWMEGHITTLELKKSRLDPESEEFKKLERVIDNYNSLIASTTKEIEEYRNS